MDRCRTRSPSAPETLCKDLVDSLGANRRDPCRGIRALTVIVCGTRPLVAAAIRTDDHHRQCEDLLTGLRLAGRAILVPPTVVAEVGYLMNQLGGNRVEAGFLLSMADGTFGPPGPDSFRLPPHSRTCHPVRGPASRHHRRHSARPRRTCLLY